MSDSPQTSEMTDSEEQSEEVQPPYKLTLEVDISTVGPCKKHVKVTIPRKDIDHYHERSLDKFRDEAVVPGFRVGHVPSKLIEKRFRQELGDQVKQDLLLESLEQISEEHELQAIDQPDMDLTGIDLPEEGDFTYEFDVEVRPEFDLPEYEGLTVSRPSGEVTDEDVARSRDRYLLQYAALEKSGEAIAEGDLVTLSLKATHEGEELRRIDEFHARVKPILRFVDAELTGFDKLVTGKSAGDEVTTEVKISSEASNIEKRGETVSLRFTIESVSKVVQPELDSDFLTKVGVETAEELDDAIRQSLERQLEYEQRQSARKDVLDQITSSADWDLPEDLVLKQADNAMNRERLEMQQAGYTRAQILARENEMQQQAVTETRQALKEHFVLDKIATQEKIEVAPSDIEFEIQQMGWSRGENPRRVRARLQKSGMIENLEAQIRERKAVDFILSKAQFKEVPRKKQDDSDNIEAVRYALCQKVTAVAAEEDSDDEEE